MKITLNGKKHTVPDDSTHVAAEVNGALIVITVNVFTEYNHRWNSSTETKCFAMLQPPTDFTKCMSPISNGCVVDFEGM